MTNFNLSVRSHADLDSLFPLFGDNQGCPIIPNLTSITLGSQRDAEARLWAGVTCIRCVVDDMSEVPVGIISCHRIDLRNRHMHLGAWFAPQVSLRARGHVTMSALIERAHALDMRKVYCEVIDSDIADFKAMTGEKFTQEGLLVGDVRLRSQFHDRYVFAANTG